MLEPYTATLLWIVIVGFVIAFVLAFGIGANDVANSFGTSVGSKVLTVPQACCLATVFEIAGAVLIGYKVSDTMRKGILDVSLYEGHEMELMLGCLSALTASAAWLILATFLKLPISGTHSIVGATVGFSLVARGSEGLNWKTLMTIVISWFVSPVLSGSVSVIIYAIINRFILSGKNPLKNGLNSLPFFYGFTLFVNIFSILHDGPKLLHADGIPLWQVIVWSATCGIVTGIIVKFLFVPWQKREIANDLKNCLDNDNNMPETPVNFQLGTSNESTPDVSPRNTLNIHVINEQKQLSVISEHTEMLPLNGTKTKTSKKNEPKNNNTETTDKKTTLTIPQPPLPSIDSSSNINPLLTPNSSAVPLILERTTLRSCDSIDPASNANGGATRLYPSETDGEKVSKLFSFLQVLTATFGSFAHGGNDVSNAIGPLIALWLIYTEGSVEQKSETPLAILLYGGVGISVGLWLWGRRVIQTVGEDLTTITPSTGFTIEIGSAFTVLLASKIGVPVSTTHCKVGSVVFVGYAYSQSRGVDWKLFRNIISAWVVTVPVAAILSASSMGALTAICL